MGGAAPFNQPAATALSSPHAASPSPSSSPSDSHFLYFPKVPPPPLKVTTVVTSTFLSLFSPSLAVWQSGVFSPCVAIKVLCGLKMPVKRPLT